MQVFRFIKGIKSSLWNERGSSSSDGATQIKAMRVDLDGGELEWQNAGWEEFSGFEAAKRNLVTLQNAERLFYVREVFSLWRLCNAA